MSRKPSILDELDPLRREAARRDRRRNQVITRGEILDALDNARAHISLTDAGTDTYVLLDTLRRVLE